MKLRPHHLLCTQSYEGMGYSKEFTENMDEKIVLLRGKESYEIELVTGLDDLCLYCPHNEGEICETEEKVNLIDKKVCNSFGLQQGKYIYQDLIKKIQSEITKETMKEICGACSWYESGRCVELIVKR